MGQESVTGSMHIKCNELHALPVCVTKSMHYYLDCHYQSWNNQNADYQCKVAEGTTSQWCNKLYALPMNDMCMTNYAKECLNK